MMIASIVLLLPILTTCRSETSGNPLESCKLSKDAGPCMGNMPRFFYSTAVECLKFTYGGCKGNANNFKDLAICEQACYGN